MSSTMAAVTRSVPFQAAILLLLACSGGGGGGGGGEPTGGAIQTGWDVQSARLGESVTIKVEAVDSTGSPVTFTTMTEGGCASVATASDAVTVTANNEPCARGAQRIVLTSSTGVTKELTVNVYDPKVMDIGDGLLIKYVNAWQKQWDSSGSGGDQRIAYYHPVTGGDGWYALGSLVRIGTFEAPGPSVPMIVVKDSRAVGALAPPTDYAWVYDDYDSGATLFGSMWKPVCPAGFKALGVVTNGASTSAGWSKPSLDAVRCVNAAFTTPGKIGDRLYSDVGTGARAFGSVWAILDPDTTPPDAAGRALLHPGTALGCGAMNSTGWSSTSCDPAIVNLLFVPVPVMQSADATDVEPRLTGYHELDLTRPRYFSSVRIPFTMIASQARADRVDWNVRNSPFYTLERSEVYSRVGSAIDNRQNPNPSLWKQEITTGFEQTKVSTFKQEIGLEITASGDAKFLGAGGSIAVTLTGKLGWEQMTSSTYSTFTKYVQEYTVPSGVFAEIIQVKTQFCAVGATGLIVGDPLEGGSSTIKYLQYPR